MYPLCGIDKARGRGETWPVDPEMRDAFDRLGADLRGQIRTSAEEDRVYLLDATTAGLVHEIRESESRVRRHFEGVGESLRGDIRGVAELVALSSEASKRRDDELAERTDRLEGRVTRLEVRVKDLEDGREPRRGSTG